MPPKQKSKRKPGRPTKFTPETRAKIIEALKGGNYRDTSYAIAGISHETFYDWVRRGEAGEAEYSEFLEAVKEAESFAEAYHVQNIRKAAEAGTWTAGAWWLERKRHEKWGRKDRVFNELTGKDGKDLIPNTRNRLRNLSGEELALLAHVLRGDETEEKAS